MKRVSVILCFLLTVSAIKPVVVQAQEQEVQQLLLNVEKLAQFVKILNDLYKGYEILKDGYNAIKNISEGNFSIHKLFLDGLMQVSPAVKKYKRVADIVEYQVRIVNTYKSAYNSFKQDNNFSPVEIEYMGQVYGNLTELCLKNVDDLITVTTAGKLRMSDNERIEAIDRIYVEVTKEWGFLNQFNNTAKLLSIARAKEQMEVDLSKVLSGVK